MTSSRASPRSDATPPARPPQASTAPAVPPVGADLGEDVPALVEEARVGETGEVTQGLEGGRGG